MRYEVIMKPIAAQQHEGVSGIQRMIIRAANREEAVSVARSAAIIGNFSNFAITSLKEIKK